MYAGLGRGDQCRTICIGNQLPKHTDEADTRPRCEMHQSICYHHLSIGFPIAFITLSCFFSPFGDCAWSVCRVNDHCTDCCSLFHRRGFRRRLVNCYVNMSQPRVSPGHTPTQCPINGWYHPQTVRVCLHSIRYISSVSSLWKALFVSQCPLDHSPTHNAQWSHCRRTALD